MIKILHLSPTDIRYDSRILKELEVLTNLDNCLITAFGIEDNSDPSRYSASTCNIETFALISKKLFFISRPIRYFFNLIEAIFRLTPALVMYRPNIVHCHDTLFLPIALIGKLFCRYKLIYDAHELESDKAGQSKVLSKYTFFIEKIVWKSIDLLITVSPSIIKWYDQNLGKKESLLILNSPVFDAGALEKTKNNYLREVFDIPVESKVFVYLGIISSKGRGVDFYLDAFERDDVHSHVVFIGYGEYVDEIKKRSLVSPNIHYHPAVPHNKVVEITKSADVGLCLIEPVSLSDYYCLPNKLFEYGFSGLYVLASNLPDIKQTVEDYSLGECCNLNADSVYNSIKKIEATDIKMSSNISDLYHLSWAYQAEKLLKAYMRLLTIK